MFTSITFLIHFLWSELLSLVWYGLIIMFVFQNIIKYTIEFFIFKFVLYFISFDIVYFPNKLVEKITTRRHYAVVRSNDTNSNIASEKLFGEGLRNNITAATNIEAIDKVQMIDKHPVIIEANETKILVASITHSKKIKDGKNQVRDTIMVSDFGSRRPIYMSDMVMFHRSTELDTQLLVQLNNNFKEMKGVSQYIESNVLEVAFERYGERFKVGTLEDLKNDLGTNRINKIDD